jgi:uncharacterized protein affecting Mg2+/Co2+ transport
MGYAIKVAPMQSQTRLCALGCGRRPSSAASGVEGRQPRLPAGEAFVGSSHVPLLAYLVFVPLFLG